MRNRLVVSTLAAVGFATLTLAFGVAQGTATAGQIKIGVSEPLTGSEASYGQDMSNAIALAVEEINAAGGIGGKKIVLRVEDDACDPQQAVAAANKLVAEGVVAMVGGYCSGSVLPTLSVFNEHSIPYVIPCANSMKITLQNPGNGFQINGTAVHQSQKFVDLMQRLKLKSTVIVDQGDAFSGDLAANAKSAFEAVGGKVLAVEVANKGEPDFSPMIAEIMAKQPDSIFWTAYYADGGLLVKQLKNAGYNGAIICGDGNIDPNFIAIGGLATEGVYVLSAPMLEYLPGGKTFLNAYMAKYKKAPGPYGPLAYDGMKLMADAIKRANSLDGSKIIQALKDTRNFPGIAGKINFKSDNTLRDSNFVVIRVKGGKFVLYQ
jgi:branched-chain amino acid transport system substrate-binding protein